MKRLLFAFVVLLATLQASAQSSTPSSETIFQEWDRVAESENSIDVSYRVIKCLPSGPAQVHLFIFNESGDDQTAHFDVEIINTEVQKFTKTIQFATVKSTMYKAECGSDSSLNALKIDLPSGYDPTKVLVKVTFKP